MSYEPILCAVIDEAQIQAGIQTAQRLMIDMGGGGVSKICPVCHEKKEISEFYKDRSSIDGLTYKCKPCCKKQISIWRTNNPDREKQRKREKSYIEQAKKQKKSWREKHPDYDSIYKANHIERKREVDRAWRKKHPEKMAIASVCRRARVNGSVGTFTEKEWRELKARYGYKCLKCGKKEPEISLTRDHVIPLVLGGDNTIENIQCLCFSCNSSKGKKNIDYRQILQGGKQWQTVKCLTS